MPTFPDLIRQVLLSELQEILKSLVAAPVDGGELGQEAGPTPYHPDPALKTHPMLPMQFHSFDRLVPVWPTRGGVRSQSKSLPINSLCKLLLIVSST